MILQRLGRGLLAPRKHGAIIVVLMVLLGAGGIAWLLRRGSAPPDFSRMTDSQLSALARTHPSVAVLGTLFQRTLRRGACDQSLSIAQEMVRRYPQDARAHNALGIAFVSVDRLEDAHREFTTSITLDPRRIEGYVNLGRLAMKMRNYDRAKIEFDRATAVDPNSASAWRGLGEAEAALGERSPVSEALQKAIALAPHDPAAYVDLGCFHAEMGRNEEGRALLQKAFDLGDRSGKLYAGLTMAYADQPQSQDELNRALQCAAEAEKRGDQSSLLFYAKGLALQRLGRYKEAIGVYRQAVTVSPNANGPWIGLSQCYRALGRMDIAEEAARIGERLLTQRQKIGNLEHQIQSSPDRLDLREQYAGIMMANHQYLLAADQYRYIAQHEPGDPKAWLKVARAFELGGKPDLAKYLRAYVRDTTAHASRARSLPAAVAAKF
ncbi:MAG: tetratricopeptide repeat protein [Chthonomonadales bacterium]